MRMSNQFTLPTEIDRDGKVIADDKYKAQFDGRGMTAPNTASLTHRQAMYITHAVNNYDDLVDVISKVIDCSRTFDAYDFCNFCHETDHKEDCAYVSAVNLLDKIKGDLK